LAATSVGTVQAINITGSSSTGQLAVGQATQLRATAQMVDGSSADVSLLATWISDDSSIATVTKSGLVTASKLGSANITAQYLGAMGRFPLVVRDAATMHTQPPAPGNGPAPPADGTPPNPSPNPSPSPPSNSAPCTNPLPVTPPSPLPPCPNLPIPPAA
jgi:hypothetical protein